MENGMKSETECKMKWEMKSKIEWKSEQNEN